MNSNKTIVPVAARPCAGTFAASLGARPSLGVPVTSRTAAIREMAPSRAAAGVRMPWLSQRSALKPRFGFAQRTQNNPTPTYTHAIGAVATGNSQMGSLSAWDPV